MKVVRFPEGFCWGTATASYQIEGGKGGENHELFSSCTRTSASWLVSSASFLFYGRTFAVLCRTTAAHVLLDVYPLGCAAMNLVVAEACFTQEITYTHLAVRCNEPYCCRSVLHARNHGKSIMFASSNVY